MGQPKSNDDFSMVVLTKINPEAPLPVDLYVHIDNKYLKLKSRGDFLSVEKYNYFIAKGVKHLFIHSGDIMSFVEWVSQTEQTEMQEMVEVAGTEHTGTIELGVELKNRVYETFNDQALDKDKVQSLMNQTSEFIDEVRKNPLVIKAIAALMKRNQTVADHSVNVANMAVYIAMLMGHNHQLVLENLYLGAIFHDYGKAKIDPNALESQSGRLYSQAIQDHPANGVKIIGKSKGISEQVFSIIMEHHEQYNGGGFPRGLKGDEIYELAAIASIANMFDNTLVENRHLPPLQRFRKAIKVITYQNGKAFHPKFFPRVVEGLEKALLDDPTPKKWVA